MTAIALLFLVISFSMFITRTAAVMLELTGMARDSARFQSRAAYCGVGYSSRESEGIMEHPVRRRIISTLMLLGNAGTATVVATLVISFRGVDHWVGKAVILVVGLVGLYVVAHSQWLDQRLREFVQWALTKYTRLDLNDYTALLHLAGDYSILEVEVQTGDWLAGNTLSKLALPKEGVLVLGVRKSSGDYVGAPTAGTIVEPGDTLTMYGKLERLEELNRRRTGVAGLYAHAAAVDEHKQEAEQEAKQDAGQDASQPDGAATETPDGQADGPADKLSAVSE